MPQAGQGGADLVLCAVSLAQQTLFQRKALQLDGGHGGQVPSMQPEQHSLLLLAQLHGDLQVGAASFNLLSWRAEGSP